MYVKVNGSAQEVRDGTTVAGLLAQCELEPRRVAVEVNAALVPRRHFDETTLAADDVVEIVTLVGGG